MRIGIAALIVGIYALGCNALVDPDEISRPLCEQDEDCNDDFFCNGPEHCDPSNPDADGFGCIDTGPDVFLDDGINCTFDRCDEETRSVIHDASGCACEGDGNCELLHAGPCVAQTRCETGVCVVDLSPAGSACDDGVECTQDTRCDAQGQCIGQLSDTQCNDGLFCNGSERCSPADPGADATSGCVGGIPPAQGADTEVECAEAVCEEDSAEIIELPTDRCECRHPSDCGPAGNCRVWRCDASSEFTCVEVLAQAQAACDDEIECTVGDRCTDDGQCIGSLSDALCDDMDVCNGEETCSNSGCLPGQTPDPAPEQCR